jgi:hypothetical protein
MGKLAKSLVTIFIVLYLLSMMPVFAKDVVIGLGDAGNDGVQIEQHLKMDTTSVTIMQDDGGIMERYMRNYDILKMRRIQVRIAGWCISSCMFYMKLPGACAMRGGQFWAHTPTIPPGKKERRFVYGLMDKYYFPEVRQRIKDAGGIFKIGKNRYLKINASDVLPPCQ